MSKKTTYKISLPVRKPKLNFYDKVLSIKNFDFDLLQDGITKIEDLAYSNEQLKSINDFLIENLSRLYTLNLSNDNMYQYWTVHKRYDDILFRIYEVWGANMTIEDKKYLFPFVGGKVEVSDTVKFNPDRNGFEYQFHLYNNTDSQ